MQHLAHMEYPSGSGRSVWMEARRVLSDPAEGRRVSEIGASLGFNGEAQFSRSFRRQFGASPSEIRRAAAVQPTPLPDADPDIASSYRAWIGRGGWAVS